MRPRNFGGWYTKIVSSRNLNGPCSQSNCFRPEGFSPKVFSPKVFSFHWQLFKLLTLEIYTTRDIRHVWSQTYWINSKKLNFQGTTINVIFSPNTNCFPRNMQSGHPPSWKSFKIKLYLWTLSTVIKFEIYVRARLTSNRDENFKAGILLP